MDAWACRELRVRVAAGAARGAGWRRAFGVMVFIHASFLAEGLALVQDPQCLLGQRGFIARPVRRVSPTPGSYSRCGAWRVPPGPREGLGPPPNHLERMAVASSSA